MRTILDAADRRGHVAARRLGTHPADGDGGLP